MVLDIFFLLHEIRQGSYVLGQPAPCRMLRQQRMLQVGREPSCKVFASSVRGKPGFQMWLQIKTEKEKKNIWESKIQRILERRQPRKEGIADHSGQSCRQAASPLTAWHLSPANMFSPLCSIVIKCTQKWEQLYIYINFLKKENMSYQTDAQAAESNSKQ